MSCASFVNTSMVKATWLVDTELLVETIQELPQQKPSFDKHLEKGILAKSRDLEGRSVVIFGWMFAFALWLGIWRDAIMFQRSGVP
jgi:hypothetical protein